MEEFKAISGNCGVTINRIPVTAEEIESLLKAEKIKAQSKKLSFLNAVLKLGRIHNINFENDEQKQAINEYINRENKIINDKKNDKWRASKIRR